MQCGGARRHSKSCYSPAIRASAWSLATSPALPGKAVLVISPGPSRHQTDRGAYTSIALAPPTYRVHSDVALSEERTVTLILYYVAFMIGGDFAAYFLGLLVEYEWGKNVSLIVFLALYFFSLWVAWMLAVWVTTPRGATSSA